MSRTLAASRTYGVWIHPICDSEVDVLRFHSNSRSLRNFPLQRTGKYSKFHPMEEQGNEPLRRHIDVEQIARLARLEISEEQKAKFAGQLEDIFGYVDRLKEVDVSGVSPAAHPLDFFNNWAEDLTETSLPQEAVIQNSPDAEDGQVVVPRVVE